MRVVAPVKPTDILIARFRIEPDQPTPFVAAAPEVPGPGGRKQPIAKVGKTGDASACHVHFGISPACAKTGDWFNRRGLVWPWPYLDAWKAGTEKSPVAEVKTWQDQHGCPTKPLTK